MKRNETLRRIAAAALAAGMALACCGGALADGYMGGEAQPGQAGIQPGDSIQMPGNTAWATLTASWAVEVRFVADDEAMTLISSEEVAVADGVPGECGVPADPQRDGATFKGWARIDNGTGKATLEGGKVTGVEGPGPIVFQAQFEALPSPVPPGPVVPKTGDEGNSAAAAALAGGLAALAGGVALARRRLA